MIVCLPTLCVLTFGKFSTQCLLIYFSQSPIFGNFKDFNYLISWYWLPLIVFTFRLSIMLLCNCVSCCQPVMFCFYVLLGSISSMTDYLLIAMFKISHGIDTIWFIMTIKLFLAVCLIFLFPDKITCHFKDYIKSSLLTFYCSILCLFSGFYKFKQISLQFEFSFKWYCACFLLMNFKSWLWFLSYCLKS